VEPFEVDGVRFGRDTIGDRFKRRAIENLLLAITQQSMAQQPNVWELLNISIDPLEKVRQEIQKLPPHAIRELLKKYGRS
jgi:hypothetical protein